LFKTLYASLGVLVLLQTINGWVQGMGWPPAARRWCTGSVRAHAALRRLGLARPAQRGGRAGRDFALVGVALFNDWGAKFYFNALIAAGVAVVVFFLMRDTPQLQAFRRSRNTRMTTGPTTARITSERSRLGKSSSTMS